MSLILSSFMSQYVNKIIGFKALRAPPAKDWWIAFSTTSAVQAKASLSYASFKEAKF